MLCFQLLHVQSGKERAKRHGQLVTRLLRTQRHVIGCPASLGALFLHCFIGSVLFGLYPLHCILLSLCLRPVSRLSTDWAATKHHDASTLLRYFSKGRSGLTAGFPGLHANSCIQDRPHDAGRSARRLWVQDRPHDRMITCSGAIQQQSVQRQPNQPRDQSCAISVKVLMLRVRVHE